MRIYNPYLHLRKSIRLKGYDYSQSGLYFVTICCQDRAFLFGEVVEGEMKLNEFGELNFKIWQRNYYESIIRSERAYHNIFNYIANNPKKWATSKRQGMSHHFQNRYRYSSYD
jgi:REP element-mobilizing transposase RayT